MTAAPLLSLLGVSRSYGSVVAVHSTTLSVAAGSFNAILGPSGCGKSTLLRMIGGFDAPTAGRICIDGTDVTALPPQRRPTNMVFQGHGLFPHMTVAQNVGFGLSVAGVARAEIARRVAEAVALVRLEGQADRLVTGLSGGQQQRVALARALILRPKILLLDEPLSALDLRLRQAMQDELRRIHRAIGGTFIFVTHDQGEAFALADRLIVMNAGRIVQVGPPHEVYRRPADLFVARFVGEANVLDGRRAAGRVTLAFGPGCDLPGPDGPVTLVLRPEDITLDPVPGAMVLQAEVRERQHLVGAGRLVVQAGGATLQVALPRAATALDLADGARVTLYVAPHALAEVQG